MVAVGHQFTGEGAQFFGGLLVDAAARKLTVNSFRGGHGDVLAVHLLGEAAAGQRGDPPGEDDDTEDEGECSVDRPGQGAGRRTRNGAGDRREGIRRNNLCNSHTFKRKSYYLIAAQFVARFSRTADERGCARRKHR